MKPAKMSDKVTERKIIQVSRTLPELTVKHFFLLPVVCTFRSKIKSLPEYGATLVFHLVSARTVSPLCSAKGLTITNSIQDFPKLPIIKEKWSAVSQPTSSSHRSCREAISHHSWQHLHGHSEEITAPRSRLVPKRDFFFFSY